VIFITIKQNIFLERIDSFYKNKIAYLFREIEYLLRERELVVVIKINNFYLLHNFFIKKSRCCVIYL